MAAQAEPSAGGGLFQPQLLSSESVLQVYGPWKEPDAAEAERKYHAAHIQHQTFDMDSAEIKDFKEFGPGHLLYFYFLRFMAIVFLVLLVMPGIPMIIIYSGGKFLGSSGTDFEVMSLGNYGLPSSNTPRASLNISLPTTHKGADAELVMLALFQSSADLPAVRMETLQIDKVDALVAVSVLDLIGILFYFGACIFLIWKMRIMNEQVDETVTSLPDYSVQAEGVPPDTTPQQVQEYFEQWGEVVQVECARKCNTLVEMVQERRQVLDDLDLATAVLQRAAGLATEVDEELELEVLNLKYDLSLLTEAIKVCQLTQGGADVVRAYVTYKDDLGKEAALAARPKSAWHRWKQPHEQFFRSAYQLQISAAPEATDIMFENLEFTPLDRLAARTVTWAFKALLVIIGFVLVSIAPSIKRNLGSINSSITTELCDANCSWRNAQGGLYLNDTMRTVYKGCYDTGVYSNAISCQGATICYECFCKAALSSSMYEEQGYCSAFDSVLLQAVAAQALTVFSIVAVNMCVIWLITRVTKSEMHRTRTHEGNSAMSALFVTQFINSAFSILVANMYLPQIQANLPEAWQRVLFGGIYADTTPNWYREVGKALVVSHLIGIPVRLASIWANILKVKFARKRSKKALTQSQLDKCYQGHEFLLSPRYGEHLSVIFVGLVFSAGLPGMYLSLAISFLAHYHIEKYELLKVCKWPNSMSNSLATTVGNTLPLAALWHLLGAIWMISMIGTPRSSIVGQGSSGPYGAFEAICSAFSKVWQNTNQLSGDQMARRLAATSTAHLVYALVILALTLFVFFTFKSWVTVYHIVRSWTGKTSQADVETEGKSHGVPEFPLAVRSKLIVGPTSYDMRTNPNYAHAFERLEDHWIADKDVARVEAQEKKKKAGFPLALRQVREERRRRRRERARVVLREEGNALEAAGHAAPHTARLRTQESMARGALPGNQVLPWAGAGAHAGDAEGQGPYQLTTTVPFQGDPGGSTGSLGPDYAHMAVRSHAAGGGMLRAHGTRLQQA